MTKNCDIDILNSLTDDVYDDYGIEKSMSETCTLEMESQDTDMEIQDTDIEIQDTAVVNTHETTDDEDRHSSCSSTEELPSLLSLQYVIFYVKSNGEKLMMHCLTYALFNKPDTFKV